MADLTHSSCTENDHTHALGIFFELSYISHPFIVQRVRGQEIEAKESKQNKKKKIQISSPLTQNPNPKTNRPPW